MNVLHRKRPLKLAAMLLAAPLLTPLRLAQTLWASRALLSGRKQHLLFTLDASMRCKEQQTRLLAIRRHGRTGRCPYLGNGDQALNTWVRPCLPALSAFAAYPAGSVIMSLCCWYALTFLWAPVAGLWAVLAATFLLVASPVLHHAFFASPAPSLLGFAFAPLGLFGMLSGQWPLAAFGWLAAAVFSVEAGVSALIVCLAAAVAQQDPAPLLAALPAAAKLLLHLAPGLYSGDPVGHTRELFRGVKRHLAQAVLPSVVSAICLAGAHGLLAWLLWSSSPAGAAAVVASTCVVLVAAAFSRQSLPGGAILMLAACDAAAVLHSGRLILLPALWPVLASALPLMPMDDLAVFLFRPAPAPLPFQSVDARIESLLRPVEPGQTVLFVNTIPEQDPNRHRSDLLVKAAGTAAAGRRALMLPNACSSNPTPEVGPKEIRTALLTGHPLKLNGQRIDHVLLSWADAAPPFPDAPPGEAVPFTLPECGGFSFDTLPDAKTLQTSGLNWTLVRMPTGRSFQAPGRLRPHLPEEYVRFMSRWWAQPVSGLMNYYKTRDLKRLEIRSPRIDISCGDGSTTFLALGGAFELGSETPSAAPAQRFSVGTDFNRGSLVKAARLGAHETLLVHDNADPVFPFPEGHFRTVYHNALYFLKDPKVFLRSIHASLQPGGHCLIQVWTDRFFQLFDETAELFSPSMIHTHSPFTITDSHHSRYTYHQWERMMREAGFTIRQAGSAFPAPEALRQNVIERTQHLYTEYRALFASASQAEREALLQRWIAKTAEFYLPCTQEPDRPVALEEACYVSFFLTR